MVIPRLERGGVDPTCPAPRFLVHAGLAEWFSTILPSWIHGFDSRSPLHRVVHIDDPTSKVAHWIELLFSTQKVAGSNPVLASLLRGHRLVTSDDTNLLRAPQGEDQRCQRRTGGFNSRCPLHLLSVVVWNQPRVFANSKKCSFDPSTDSPFGKSSLDSARQGG